MTQLAIHWSHENFKTALPYRDQAPYIKKQVWSFSKEKIYKHKEQKQFLKATTSLTMTVLRASFLVANSIAKAKKSFSTGKELILPAAEDICCEILGDVMVQKVACIPLLANTITRQIDEIAEDINAQLLERSDESPWYAIQVYEPTDVDNKATMLVFMWYIF